MDFAGINYLAVVVAAVAAFVFGAVYYGSLGKPWMKAARIDPGEAKMSRDGTLRWRYEHRGEGEKFFAAEYFYNGRWVTAIEESLASGSEG